MSQEQIEKTKHNRCKSCSTSIENKSANFLCVACGECMHLTPKCTGLSNEYKWYSKQHSLNMPKLS